MTIEWKDDDKIGNAAIDVQHQVWFARINRFLEATERKIKPRQELRIGAELPAIGPTSPLSIA
jgi:hemerythrin